MPRLHHSESLSRANEPKLPDPNNTDVSSMCQCTPHAKKKKKKSRRVRRYRHLVPPHTSVSMAAARFNWRRRTTISALLSGSSSRVRCGVENPPSRLIRQPTCSCFGDGAEGAEEDEVNRPGQVETLSDNADGGDQHPWGGGLRGVVAFVPQPVDRDGDEGFYSGQAVSRALFIQIGLCLMTLFLFTADVASVANSFSRLTLGPSSADRQWGHFAIIVRDTKLL